MPPGGWSVGTTCGARLDELPRYPVGNASLLEWQRRLTEQVAAQRSGVSRNYETDLHMALR